MPLIDFNTGFPCLEPARLLAIVKRYLTWRDSYRQTFEQRILLGWHYGQILIDLDYPSAGTVTLRITQNEWQQGGLLRDNGDETWEENLLVRPELEGGIAHLEWWLGFNDSIDGISWTTEQLRAQASVKYAAAKMFTFMLGETARNSLHYRPRVGATGRPRGH